MRGAWRRWMAIGFGLGLGVLAACGGGEDLTKAQVRVVNASGYAALTSRIGDETVASAVAYGADAGYRDVDREGTSSELSSPSAATVLSTAGVALGKAHHYTLLAYGRQGALQQVLIDDEIGAPSSGRALVRVINAAADAGTVDVYLTAPGDSLAASTPVQALAAYGTVGGLVTINSGTWQLRVTAGNSKTDVRLDLPAVAFDSQSVRTIVITPGRGGVLVNALVLQQQGTVVNAANTQARVRVVAGAGGGEAVSASVGGVTLVDGAAAPARTAYTTLGAGTLAVAASAGGSSAALTSATLEGGGDYTLLVWGASGAAQAVLLPDDNARPGDATKAKLRLVNGVNGAAGALSLKVELLVTASGVAAGAASAYTEVDAASTPQLDVSAAGAAGTLCSVGNKDLVANAVYTLFALGDAGGPASCALAPDR